MILVLANGVCDMAKFSKRKWLETSVIHIVRMERKEEKLEIASVYVCASHRNLITKSQ